MKKKKLVFLAFATIAIALLLEAGILKYVNDSNTYRMSKVLLDRVITVLNKNDDSENGLIESLKDDYIVRAKAVSYIIDAKPQVEYDVEELQKIADLILDISTVVLCPNTMASVLTPESRWNILSLCLQIKSLPCVRMLLRIPLKERN